MVDQLSALFLICCSFGVILSAITWLTGAAHLPILGAHALHIGHAMHVHPAAHGSMQETSSPFNLGSVLAFLIWFGGVGFLLHALSALALLLVVVLASLAGLAGAVVIALFLVKVLVPAQTIVDPNQYRLDGTSGRITAAIPAGGTGEITYSKAGTRRSDAARSIDDQALPHGAEVVIMGYRRGVAYVQTLDRYLNSPASEVAGRLAALEKDGSQSEDPRGKG